MSFPIDFSKANVIALGDFTHPLDATPEFFTHWSTLSNLGTVTINIENDSTVTMTATITRFVGSDITIEINAANNRSVTVPGAKSLLINELPADTVVGQYVIVLN